MLRNIGKNDVTVMVDLSSPGDHVQYYLADTAAIDKRLRTEFDEWKATPGKSGQQRDQANKVRRFTKSPATEKFLQQAKDRWTLITERLEMSHER